MEENQDGIRITKITLSTKYLIQQIKFKSIWSVRRKKEKKKREKGALNFKLLEF